VKQVSEVGTRLREFLATWLYGRAAEVRAALSVGIPTEDTTEEQADSARDAELRDERIGTRNRSSRFGQDAPGYLTRNGLGSLEIGAADD